MYGMKAREILLFILIIHLTLNVNSIRANRTDIILSTTHSIQIQDNEISITSQTSSLIINDDLDFITYNLPGSGTKEDPYLIENYQISTTGRVAGIDIRKTTKHFNIRNCTIETDSWGIIISEIAPNTALITNNEFLNNDYKAITIYKSNGTTISNNDFKNNYEAISLKKSSFSTIKSNSFEGNWAAVSISGTASCSIEKNNFTSNVHSICITAVNDFTIKDNMLLNNIRNGISLYVTDNTLVLNNTCSNSGWQGILVIQSKFAVLNDNTLINDGIHIDHYTAEYMSCSNNKINSRILGFFKNKNDLELRDSIYGQLILVDCDRGAISYQNLSNTSVGIVLYNCDETTITNNSCNNNDGDGIEIHDSDRCLISNNTCSNNEDGISILNSNYCKISNNVLIRNWESIKLIESNSIEINLNKCFLNKNHGITARFSEYVFITNNNCSDNHNIGIIIADSMYFVIANNSCINNNDDGIYIPTADYCIIYNNYCQNNTNGIFIGHPGESIISEYIPPPASYSLVVSNHLEENRKYGVYLNRMTEDNSVHHNSFINNNEEGLSQGYDNGEGNTWYDKQTNEGNFWSNHIGIGSYLIAGEANSIDKNPLKEPKIVEMPEISSSRSTYRTKFNPQLIYIGIVALVILRRRKLRIIERKL